MANNVKKPSLIATVIWTIFFFPVGLYFIYRRCTYNKIDPAGNCRKLKTFSNVMLAFGLLYFLVAILEPVTTDDGKFPMFIIVFFFWGLGVLLLFKAIKLSRVGKRYILYRHIIKSGQAADINSIARMVSGKPEVVEAEIQELIDEGCFPGVFINFGTKEIIYKTGQPMNQQAVNINNMVQSTPKEIQPKARTIKCPSCGGINRVVDGETCECEFCSTPLS